MRGLFVSLLANALVAHAADQVAFLAPNAHRPPQSSQRAAVLAPEVLADVKVLIEKGSISGVALAVVTRDAPTEFANFGVRTEDGDPVTSNTLFTIASCSKAFLTAAVGILIDDYAHGRNTTPLPDGLTRLDWDTKVKDILPGQWKLADSWAEEKAALKDIFSHVSGLPRHDFSYWRSDLPKDILDRLHLLRPAFELREQWSYNNIMYMIGAHILDTYTGSFTKFVHDRLFVPLNMTTSTYSPAEAHAHGAATQTFSQSGRRMPWWFKEDDYLLSAGPGGVVASTEGLASWVRTLLHEGVNPATNETVFPKDVFNTVTSSRALSSGVGTQTESISGYGLGWMRVSYRGHDIIWHSGSVPGIGTLVMFAPQDGVGLVVLTNTDSSYLTNTAIAWRVFRAAFGIAEDSMVPPLVDVGDCAVGAPYKTKRTRGDTGARSVEELPTGVDFTGAYAAEGYGPGFALCNISSTSHYCLETLASFQAVYGDLSSTSLYGVWPRLWSTHIRLDHIGGARFKVATTSLFPKGYGKNTTAFSVGEGGEEGGGPRVEFVVEDGFVKGGGLLDTVGVPTLREKKGGSVEEIADAWFIRA